MKTFADEMRDLVRDNTQGEVIEPKTFLRWAEQAHTVVKLTQHGLSRVLNGKEGMTFIVNHFSGGEVIEVQGKRHDCQLVAHVRDYRYPHDRGAWQIWSLSEKDYEVVK